MVQLTMNSTTSLWNYFNHFPLREETHLSGKLNKCPHVLDKTQIDGASQCVCVLSLLKGIWL